MKEQPTAAVPGLSGNWMRLGREGTHLLFESAWIHRAFDRVEDGGVDQHLLLSAHDALGDLRVLGSFERARAYLAALPAGTLDLVIFLYFRTLDREINEAGPTIH